jgi:hypothetical protein
MNKFLNGAVVLLIAAVLFFSTVAVTAETIKSTNDYNQPNAEVTGLAPHINKNAEKQPIEQFSERGQFYAYDAINLYTCTFDTNAVINNLYNAGISFLSGADFGPDGKWYAVEYGGGLYKIDTTTGIPTFIANTIPLNSLVYDTITDTWYCCGYDSYSVDSLFKIDITTGTTTFIGNFGAPELMISLMCDSAGNMYAYDVLFAGNSHLYDINKYTGVASNPRDMGHNFCYAQEGKFDRNAGILYLAAYDYGAGGISYLATCNPTTGAVTILNNFSPNYEIDALAIPWGDPPTNPIINGPPSGKKNTFLNYMFTSTDPDGDQISYYVDWGDGTPPTWSAFQDSGLPYSTGHSWSTDGTYTISAKAKDTQERESGFTTFTVTIPRNKATNNMLFSKLIGQFPLLQKLIQQLGL